MSIKNPRLIRDYEDMDFSKLNLPADAFLGNCKANEQQKERTDRELAKAKAEAAALK